MRLALFQPSPDRQHDALRRRVVAIVLTILAHVLLLLMLLRLAPEQFGRPSGTGITTVSLLPAAEQASAKPASARRAQPRERERATTPPPSVPPKEPPPPPPLVPPLNIVPMGHEEMALADISRLPTPPSRAGSAGAESGDTDGGSPGDTPTSGTLHGEPLYAAEWYRRPTDAELSFYLPRNRPPGAWGDIACRTVARYHVEDCEELGDSQPGSGVAHGISQAAWQFLVRPPRVGGKSMIGTWVRIRIYFTEKGVR